MSPYHHHHHQANTVPFRFLDLPGELRNRIYKEVTGSYVWPHEGWHPYGGTWGTIWVRTFDFSSDQCGSAHWANTDVKSSQFSLDPSGLRPPSPTALPLVSKRIKSEFEQILWEHTFKHFQSHTLLRRMIPLLQENIPYRSLRRISLGLPNKSFLALVGLSVTYEGELSQCGIEPLEALQNIPDLEYLHLHYQTGPPMYEKKTANWGWISGDPWVRSRPQESSPCEASCQKFMVDLVLTFALQYIRHVPHITMSGHIKDSTRAKWEHIFDDERRQVAHDMTSRMAELLSTPDIKS
jgi:hypothetical protein